MSHRFFSKGPAVGGERTAISQTVFAGNDSQMAGKECGKILDGAANQRSGTWIQHLAKSRHSSLTSNPRCNNTPITVGSRLVAGSLCSGRLQKLPKGGGILAAYDVCTRRGLSDSRILPGEARGKKNPFTA
jgi:hypothetical protein